ncbi:MAG TPA: DUF5076 domain-containing protein [Polyangia bacterium]|nr:DUF5076 domain-containing protein [Polyangia bacterium]
MNELPVPPEALADESARELARVWAARGRQHVSLEVGLWSDPAAWGVFLVDLATHVANAYQEQEGYDRKAALERIRQGFDAEWGDPTSTPSGHSLPEA